MQSTKLQPLQPANPEVKGSPGIVPQGEGPQIHAQQSPWVTPPIGSDESDTFCLFLFGKNRAAHCAVHKLCQPDSLTVRKWRGNAKMRRKWRENDEMERE